MQNVNKVIGLLNEKAPTNHFLAYINPKEANLLKSMGGSGMPGPFGIPSFIEYDDSFGSGFSAATASDDQVSSFSGGDDGNVDGIDHYTTGTEFNVTPVNEHVVDNVMILQAVV